MSRRNKRKSFTKSVFKLFLCLVVFTVLLISSISLYANVTEKRYLMADGTEEVILGKKEYVTALICGVNENLTDTIMFLKYNTNTGKLLVLSIPRDTYTENEYCSGNKINAIYRGTHIKELASEIESLLDEEIDYYMVFDTSIVVKLVDMVGGVTVNVPFDMQYDDPTQDLHIDLKAGEQVLNGEEAEGFIRFRHNNDMSVQYAMGDLGRVQIQQTFVTAFVKALLRPRNILKIGNIVTTILEETDTNIAVDDIFRYGLYALKIDMDNITTTTATGTTKYINGLSYFLLDEESTQEEIKEAF